MNIDFFRESFFVGNCAYSGPQVGNGPKKYFFGENDFFQKSFIGAIQDPLRTLKIHKMSL